MVRSEGVFVSLVAALGCLATACVTEEAPARRAVLSKAEHLRQTLYRELQPLTLQNCELQRFGEAHDGGYLLCGNLLTHVRSAYSYGISGYDQWGCDVSRQLDVPVHQYDCFDTRRTSCDGGAMIFHEECVAARTFAEEGRVFDSLQQHMQRNGDTGKRLLVKMDVEGAEWDSLIWAPAAVLDQIDQLAIEFHGVDESRFVVAVQRLKQYFHVAHLHFNNFSCASEIAPFPATAYEVLFVHKRIANVADRTAPIRPHRLDAPNDPSVPDCQAAISMPNQGAS